MQTDWQKTKVESFLGGRLCRSRLIFRSQLLQLDLQLLRLFLVRSRRLLGRFDLLLELGQLLRILLLNFIKVLAYSIELILQVDLGLLLIFKLFVQLRHLLLVLILQMLDVYENK